jgi:hypothetical protein
MVDNAVVDKILSIGRSLRETGGYSIDTLDSLRRQDAINRLAPQDWNKVSSQLKDDDLIHLAMGLTAIERDLKWTGGSVSAVIWVFRNLQNRVTESVWSSTADWILANTNNPYLPFGSQNHGAKSLSDYQDAVKLNHSKIREGLEIEKQDTESTQKEHALRVLQRRNSHIDRRSTKRQEIIANLQQKPLKERLEEIVLEETYAVNFYPTNWAHEADDSFIATLDDNLKHSLAQRLKGKQRGSWASFKKRLLRVTGIPWNRRAWFK